MVPHCFYAVDVHFLGLGTLTSSLLDLLIYSKVSARSALAIINGPCSSQGRTSGAFYLSLDYFKSWFLAYPNSYWLDP